MKTREDCLVIYYSPQKRREKQRLSFKCNIELHEYIAETPTKEQCEITRHEYKSAKKAEFLTYLFENHYDELLLHGIPHEDLLMMLEGRTPVGFSIHHKIPISLGGTNDRENLCLLVHEQHATIHKMVDWQLEVESARGRHAGMSQPRILLPMPQGNVDFNVDIKVESSLVPRLASPYPKMNI